jgi:hypothetical protein
MNFSLKPHPLIAHWVPGFMVIFIVLFSASNWDYTCLFSKIIPNEATGARGALIILTLAVVAFVIGEFLDSVRDLVVERCLDSKDPIKWDFFFKGDKNELKNLMDNYFTYYVLNWNLALGIIVSSISIILLGLLGLIEPPPCRWILIGLLVTAALLIFFIWDAMELRRDIKKHTSSADA